MIARSLSTSFDQVVFDVLARRKLKTVKTLSRPPAVGSEESRFQAWARNWVAKASVMTLELKWMF